MTQTSSTTSSSQQNQQQQQQPENSSSNKSAKPINASQASTSTSIATTCNQQQQSQLASYLSLSSSTAFQQVKQTQSSLARLSRVHHLQQQQQQQQQVSQTNQSSQNSNNKEVSNSNTTTKSTTFVDCLIRRFKDCFNEDCCSVPMFVVGNLSPGSDGTHLILPPCVSLGRQNINRFASPKNLRLINSIRESCRSIEELDLGGNKLTDLIEVYKILQCTPNLKFLNLSENDLSRSSPVAMAATCSSPSSSSTSTITASAQTTTSYLLSTTNSPAAAAAISASPSSSSSVTSNQNWSGSNHSTTTAMALNSRTYLAPINQNQQQQAASIGARRHSTLGQPSNSSSGGGGGSSDQRKSIRHPATSRVAEARRLAAANAVAQSKKTSSSVASKLTHSASANASLSHHLRHQSSHHHHHHHTHSSTCSSRTCSTNEPGRNDKTGSRLSINSRHQTSTASTMHLARSLSSLSAKDVRAASSSLSRLTSHRSSSRKVDSNLGTKQVGMTDRTTSTGRVNRGNSSSGSSSSVTTSQDLSSSGNKSVIATSSSSSASQSQSSSSPSPSTSNKGKLASGGKLFAEPIVESDDVDMNEQQVSLQALNSGSNVTTSSSASAATTATTTTTTNQPSSSSSPSSKISATQQQTGNNSTAVASSSSNYSRATTNQFGGSSFSITGIHQTTTATNQSSPNYRRTFESIKALALNNTGCQWRVVCSILSRMPNLEELHLSLNNYERIDLDINEFKHNSLKRLYLCNNPKLTNWEELDKLLIAFPSLEALSIADCNISQIPDNLDRAREWRKLCGLNINGWPIKEWPIIERLNQLPSLIDLKCRNLEILNTIDEPRHHLIARLPKLQRLNGSEIEEREHAEKAFLRFFMANSHLERPSRFHELVQIHGEIIPVDVDVDLSPPSQAHVRVVYLNRNYYRKENEDDILMSEDFLIKLMDNVEPQQNSVVQQNNLENMEVGEPNTNTNNTTTTTTNTAETEGDNKLVRLFKDEGQEVLAIEVDLRQSVRKFKSTLANLFNLDSQNLILYYIDHEMVGLMGPELIKHNQKKLWNYNVQDGDQFIVEER